MIGCELTPITPVILCGGTGRRHGLPRCARNDGSPIVIARPQAVAIHALQGGAPWGWYRSGIALMKTKVTKGQLLVQNTVVSFTRIQQGDFISLSDIAKVKNPDEPKDVVKNWLRSRSTLDFLGLWEHINNPNFKGVEFDSFKSQAGTNSFTLSPSKWIEATGAIGIRSAAGRTGGTYAHQDIAFEFASWVSAEFKLYLIKEFQRLKDDEIQAKSLEWNLTRSLSKLNYRIHTDAIAENIIPGRSMPQRPMC